MTTLHNVADLEPYQIATAEFAVDTEIEQRQIPFSIGHFQVDSYRPDVSWFEWALLAAQFAFVPRDRSVMGFVNHCVSLLVGAQQYAEPCPLAFRVALASSLHQRHIRTWHRGRIGNGTVGHVAPVVSKLYDDNHDTILEHGMTPPSAAGPALSTVENHDHLRHILSQRLEAFVGRLSDDDVQEALSEDDPNMLVTVLTTQVIDDEVTSPLAKARARGIKRRRQLIDEAGGTIPVVQLAQYEGVKPESIRRRIQRGSLIALKDHRGYHIPAIQLGEDGCQLERLGPLLTDLGHASPYRHLQWLMEPHPELEGQSPIAVIRSGKRHPMLHPLARAFGEQGGG